MAKQPKPALTRAQLALLARGALDNSAGLVEEAQVLLFLKRWPRAQALAILAAEEFGKFILCLTMGQQLESATAAKWKQFWEDFTLHKPKFAAWFGRYADEQDWGPVGSTGDQEWLQAWNARDEQAGQRNRDKQAGLYVDFDHQSGSVLVPDQRFTEDSATQMVEMVSSVVLPWMRRANGDLTSWVTPSPKILEFMAEVRQQNAAEPMDEKSALQVTKALYTKYFSDVEHLFESDTE